MTRVSLIKWLGGVALSLCVLLVLFTPFHSIISTFFLYKLNLVNFDFWKIAVPIWKEVLVAFLIAISGLLFLLKAWRWNRFFSVTLAFCLLSIFLTLIYRTENDVSVAILWGGRIELLWIGLAASLVALSQVWTDRQKKILQCSLLIALSVSLMLALILWLGGHELLINLGYRNDWSTFYLGEAPAFCQKEAGTEFCRWQSGFAGPNRFAAYLLVFAPFLSVSRNWILLGGVLLAILGTFSQGAWVALFVGSGTYLLWKTGWWQKKWLQIGCGLAVFFVMLLSVYLLIAGPPSWLDISSSQHVVRLQEGVDSFFDQPLGTGMAASGPAAFRLGADTVPENWFVQVLINQGVLGLSLYLFWWFLLLKFAWKNQKKEFKIASLLAGVMVLVQSVFLHPFEDFGVTVALFVAIVLWQGRDD